METIDFFNLRSVRLEVLQAVCKCDHTIVQHEINLAVNKAMTKPCAQEGCDCKQWKLKGFEKIGTMKAPGFPLGHVR